MKRIIFLFMVLLVVVMPWAGSVVLAGTPYPIEWIRQFGTSGEDRANGVAVDSSGSIYVVGDTEGALPGQSSAGYSDAFVRKYNSVGIEQWTHQFGTTSFDRADGIALDSSGNIFVVGTTRGALPGQSSAGDSDVFVRKYNNAGIEQWTIQFGTTSYDFAEGIAVDYSANIYVVGGTQGAFPGYANSGWEDAFIRMYNSTGIEQWTHQFGTFGDDVAFGVAVDSSGNIFVAGRMQSGQSSINAFLRKYNSAGLEQWTRVFGTYDDDDAWDVAVDATGNAYVAGRTFGALPGQSSAGSADAFVRKYNSAGTVQWTRQFGTSDMDFASGIAVDTWGNVFVAGSTYGTLPGQTSVGGSDAFIRCYSGSGTEKWTSQFGTSYYDGAYDITVDSSGNVFVAGITHGTLEHHIYLHFDAFLAKFITGPLFLHPTEYRWSALHTPSSKWDPYPSTFKSWQQVRLVNSGTGDAFNVTATITWAPANVTISDGVVTFGNIPAGGSKWSTDDFALVMDMTNPQPPNQGLLWKIEYDDSSGVHHVIENVPQ